LGSPTPSRDAPPDSSTWPVRPFGALRDALAVLRNLDQLLRSLRVGPKALATVLPEVHASCGILLVSAGALLDEVRVALPGGDEAVDTLWRFIEPRVERLEHELAEAQKRPMSAKYRLGLQKTLVSLAGDLDAARALVDLLGNAVWGARVWLSPVEIVNQSSQSAEPVLQRLPPVDASLVVSGPSGELLVNARAALALVAIGVNWVAAADSSVPPVVSIASGDAQCRIGIRQGAGTGEQLAVARWRIIDPTMACLSAAARAIGASIEATERVRDLAVTWRDSAFDRAEQPARRVRSVGSS
jgi:hypothetical protein